MSGGFRITAAGAGTVIDGFAIQGGHSGTIKAGVAVEASDVVVQNNIIRNVNATNAHNGIETTHGVNNLTVFQNSFTNNQRAIYLNPGSGHSITGNAISNSLLVGLATDGQSHLTVSGNAFSNNALEGIGSSNVGANVVVSENKFAGNGVAVAHYGGSAIGANGNYWGPGGPQ